MLAFITLLMVTGCSTMQMRPTVGVSVGSSL